LQELTRRMLRYDGVGDYPPRAMTPPTERIKPDPRLVPIASDAFAAGISVSELLQTAGLRRSTWTRWVKGAEPRESNVQHLRAVLDQMIAGEL
jgi:hypothetical protein